jgi:hypothetical protein
MRTLIQVGLLQLLLIFNASARNGRPQWTEEEAWAWHRKVGIIKGFNEAIPAYPGMSQRDVMKQAKALGFNSVRFWVKGKTPDEQTSYIKRMAETAGEFGLTISPVLIIDGYYARGNNERNFVEAEKCTRQIVSAFADDERVISWDIWNEPTPHDTPALYEQMDWIEAAVKWCRESAPIQPITASIFSFIDVNADTTNQAYIRRCEVEAMMDIHNFHHYECANMHMKSLEIIVTRLKRISDRPLMCTEALARTKGSSIPRSLIGFSQYHVHFYTWGMFTGDYNWNVTWEQTSYEPYDLFFHELLHPDGEPIDHRELDWLRDFRFAQSGENIDPGAEITERWTKERAWKWMVCGPVKGYSLNRADEKPDLAKMRADGYNGLRIKCDYNEWVESKSFYYDKLDALLSDAKDLNMRIIPVLLNDDDLGHKDSLLAEYVSDVIRRYVTNPYIQAWELYACPGKTETDMDRLSNLLRLLFRFARFEFPIQPLTATPFVQVEDFPVDFDYKGALKHGKIGGWDKLVFEGGSSPQLCNLIWQLSDVVSFAGRQDAPETGWLASIAFRYGRPLICSEWDASDDLSERETLDIFAKSHIFWYKENRNRYNRKLFDEFQFLPISTPIR